MYLVSIQSSVYLKHLEISKCMFVKILTYSLSFVAQWHQQPQTTKPKKVRPSASRYAALSDQGLDIKAAFQPEANPSHLTLNAGLVESEDL